MLVGLLSTSSVWAQAPPDDGQATVTPSKEQVELNDEAVRALIAGDYARAVSLLEAARELGALNVTFMNLGRAYQKLGNCQKAREFLEKAQTAPAVASPSRTVIDNKAKRYLAELPEECPSDTKTALAEQGAVDDEANRDKADQPDSDQREDKSTQSDIEPPGAAADGPPNTWAWVATAGGAGLVLGGVGLHFAAETKRDEVRDAGRDEDGLISETTHRRALEIEQEANTLDTVALGTAIAGGVATGVGLYLFFSDDAGDTDASSVEVRAGAQEVGVVWTKRF